MPKKRSGQFKHFQGHSASVSSNLTGQKYHGSNQDGQQTVNEKLSELRSIPSQESQQKKRELAEAVNQPSVPPHLRSILGVPESIPPRVRAGVRLRDRTRTPGPAPPKSWLLPSHNQRTALSPQQQQKRDGKLISRRVEKDRDRPPSLHHFAHISGIEPARTEKSLTHYVLKTLAKSWHLVDEDDFPGLVEIPLRLRARLVSYLAFYGDSITPGTLKALTHGTGMITFLDLSSLVGYGSLATKQLVRLFTPANQNESSVGQEPDIAESWDAADESNASDGDAPGTVFRHLTHLSLSQPSSSVSWKHLLAICRQLPQLTHLSLACWPRPTLTPNLSTSVFVSRNLPAVQAGGSHYYSAIDQDLVEPADLLKQFSSHLLCLRWLDIEGCPDWMPALAAILDERPGSSDSDGATTHRPTAGRWKTQSPKGASVFNDTWANLIYIRCPQRWMPTLDGLRATLYIPQDGLKETVMKHLLQHDYHSILPEQYEREINKASIWLNAEHKMVAAAKRINGVRRAANNKPITFDFGWRTFAP